MDNTYNFMLSKLAHGQRACPAVRKCERIHVSMPLSLRLQFGTTQATFQALTIDLSELGACVRADAPLAPGQTIELIPDQPAGVPVHCRVVWTGAVGTAQAGHAGIEFLQSLSPPV